MSADDAPREIAQQLLAKIGCSDDFTVTPLPGGRNNRVWRVRAGESDLLLKRYYWAENDTRDRMGHELDFLSYLDSIGIMAAPQALAADRESRCALLEFINGVTPTISEISDADILAAAYFFNVMNAARFMNVAQALPIASEACFSLQEHVDTTQRRIGRLDQIVPADDTARAAHAFVSETLVPLWLRVRARIIEMAPDLGGLEETLSSQERCLSPSDFGFHNSLRTPDGRLRFVDFEYSGWDDPAKTIADFANQPDMLLDDRLGDLFRARAVDLFPDPASLTARLSLLTPLYQVKWACICLNEFLPSGSARRAFTGLKTDEGLTRLAGRLERARAMALRAAKSLDFPDLKSTVQTHPHPSL
jgi:hypothetical protein